MPLLNAEAAKVIANAEVHLADARMANVLEWKVIRHVIITKTVVGV